MINRIKFISITIFIIVLISACPNPDPPPPCDTCLPSGPLTIATFNIEIFGITKAGKPEVMDILGQIIRNYGIVAIQEIRDASETAIIDLKEKVNETGREYDVITGPRVGRSTSKEQYAYLYDTKKIIRLPGEYTYDDDNDGDIDEINEVDDTNNPNDLFEREPFIARFQAYSFNFTLINIHTKPDDATVEIGYLPTVMMDAQSRLGDLDVICLGDFNADGGYFDETMYTTIFSTDTYNWLIPNSADTTVAASSNTYDRFVTTASTNLFYSGEWGINVFDQIYDFSSPTLEPDDVSDHYPVWVKFKTE